MSGAVIRNKPIRQPDRRGLEEALKIFVFALGLAAPFLLYVHLSSRQLAGEYRLSKLIEVRRQLLKERDRLLLQRAAMLSPARVNQVARESLAMVDEGPGEMTVGVPPPKDDAKPGTPEAPSGGAGGTR